MPLGGAGSAREMAAAATDHILRRMTGRGGPAAAVAAAPLSPARALRIALSRAAEKAAGLALTVLGVSDEVVGLDAVLPYLGPHDLVLRIDRGGRPVGLAIVDNELRAALIEAQTMGRLRGEAAEPRPLTAADVILTQPFVQAFLTTLAAIPGTTTPAGDEVAGDRLPDARAADMLLADGTYRHLRLSVDFGVGTRSGALQVALLPPGTPASAPDTPRFSQALQAQVMTAPAELTAVLHRLTLSMAEVEGLGVGLILPLAGVSVASVRLEAGEGTLVCNGRLGQSLGQRAVRIERLGAQPFAPLAPGREATQDSYCSAAAGNYGLPGPASSDIDSDRSVFADQLSYSVDGAPE
jgi:flagellar motor switch protein FliM